MALGELPADCRIRMSGAASFQVRSGFGAQLIDRLAVYA
jgi:hypothetical protein